MRSLLGSIVNSAPVPLSPTRNGRGVTGGGWRLGGGTSKAERHMSTMERVGTVYAIVNRIVTGVAKADWHLYRTAASGLKEDRTEVTTHAMIDLWKKPNPFMNRRKFMELAQQHVELVGENALLMSLAGLGQGKRIPLEMWPVRPDRVQPVPDPYDFIKGYVYTSPDGEKMPLDPEECQRILLPNPKDPYHGLGPVESILVDTENVKYSSEWNRAFFMNSAEPGGVIQVPVALNDTEFDRLRDQWAEDHQGVSKAHRVAILESDAKWVSNSFTHRDMQFAELRTLGRDVILEAWGMPKSMLGIVEDVNRANAEASEYVFAKWMIEERLDRWKDLLNEDILPMYGRTGEGLEWDYDSPVPENSEQDNAAVQVKSAALALLSEKGFDALELCQWLGLPELSYTKPEPKIVQVPAPGGAGQGGDDQNG